MVGLQVCDCLVFYTAENQPAEMLCFLELKAAGLKEAMEQVISVRRKVKQLLDTNHIQYITLMACICMRHQAPPGEMRYALELKRLFGKDNVRLKFGTKHDKELGSFFRSRAT